jgi:hypothetical protein
MNLLFQWQWNIKIRSSINRIYSLYHTMYRKLRAAQTAMLNQIRPNIAFLYAESSIRSGVCYTTERIRSARSFMLRNVLFPTS